MGGAFLGGSRARAFLGGRRVAGWLAGRQVFERQIDPFWDDVMLLIEGSAEDRSNSNRTVTAVGGAVFLDGVATALSATRYFTVSGEAFSFAPSDDFSIEFNVRVPNPEDTWYAFALGSAVSNGVQDETAALGFSGHDGTNQSPVWLNTGANGIVAQGTFVEVQAHHEYCLERASGIVRWYRDGVVIWTSAAAISRKLSIANPDIRIGGTAVADWASASGACDFRRCRITRAARHGGVNYDVPDSYTGG